MTTTTIERSGLGTTLPALASTLFVLQAIGAAGAVALAIIGLTGTLPVALVEIATIALGGALLAEGGAFMARRYLLLRELGESNILEVELDGGIIADLLGGAAGVTLGILSLFDIVAGIIEPIAVIAFGAALLLGGASAAGVHFVVARELEARRDAPRFGLAQSLTGEAALAVGATRHAEAGATIVLGILALISTGADPVILSLVSILIVGISLLTAAWRGGIRLFNAFGRAPRLPPPAPNPV